MSSPNIPQYSSLILNLKGNTCALKFRVSYLKVYKDEFVLSTFLPPLTLVIIQYTQVQNLQILHFLVSFVNMYFYTNKFKCCKISIIQFIYRNKICMSFVSAFTISFLLFRDMFYIVCFGGLSLWWSSDLWLIRGEKFCHSFVLRVFDSKMQVMQRLCFSVSRRLKKNHII